MKDSIFTKVKSILSRYGSAIFFCFCIPFLEILLRIADDPSDFWGPGLPRSILSGAALGLLLWFIGSCISKKLISRVFVGTVLFLTTAIFIIERCCHDFFGTYFQVSFMTEMGGQVAGDFMETTLQVIADNIWFFPLALIPFIVFIIFRKRLLPTEEPAGRRQLVIRFVCFILIQLFAVLSCRFGGDLEYYTVNYNANSAIPRFGLVTSLRLEGQYAIFGMPEPELEISFEVSATPEATTESPSQETADESLPEETAAAGEPSDTKETLPVEEEPVIYGDNVMNIDFSALEDEGSTIEKMDLYFSSQIPTKQNEYTGMFKGKNLICLTAEAFCTSAVDEKLTPTLYRLANSGFVCTNFYQPDWTQSTIGGEFAAMTGIIPTWIKSKNAFTGTIGNYMPFAFGNQFTALGYDVRAFHNSTYDYYRRDETHPSLGYENYQGLGNGLELETTDIWPYSDLEMVQSTFDTILAEHLSTGKPFHTYYMTVSGHANYSFKYNDMSARHEDAVADVEGSRQVRAYKACQIELDLALEYILNALEKAGIADDTVIALVADHYPYVLSEGDTDYYNELTGRNDSEKYTSRFENTMILWCGSMEEPVIIDTPCSAIDLIPTLSNLFGLEYDSRLLSGRDILSPDVEPGVVSTDMHVVPFADLGYGYSWITAAGTYESYTNEFTPNPGVEVGEDYVKQVSDLVEDKFTFAKYLISKDYYRHIFPGN